MATKESKVPLWIAIISLLVGGFILFIAAGVIPSDPASFQAPPIIVGLAGAVFLIAGLAGLTKVDSTWRSLFATAICAVMAAIGLWIAFGSEGDNIDGGFWFLSQETNSTIGRWAFGFGAVVVICIMFMALIDAHRRKKGDS